MPIKSNNKHRKLCIIFSSFTPVSVQKLVTRVTKKGHDKKMPDFDPVSSY